MTRAEAREEARRTGGQVAWSVEKDWYVIPGKGYIGERYEAPTFEPDAWLREGLAPTAPAAAPPPREEEWWPEWEPGFKFPWETPTGERFQAPWTTEKPPPSEEWLAAQPPPGVPPPPPREEWPEGFIPVWDSKYGEYTWKHVGVEERGITQQPMPPRNQWQEGFYPVPDGMGGWRWQPLPSHLVAKPEMTTAEKTQLDMEKADFEASLKQAEWQRQFQEQQFAWQQEQAMMPETMTEYQAGQLGLGQQQAALAQQQAQWQREYQQWQQTETQRRAEVEQRNYLARLGAQPRSWLEYKAAAGETAAIPPWMLPLMPQQYAGMVAGEPIPEWVTTPQGEGQPFSMAGLPALTQPSRQYQARMGPTALEQYYGYRQARTGVPPEEEQWRLWSQAPPGGRRGGLSYVR